MDEKTKRVHKYFLQLVLLYKKKVSDFIFVCKISPLFFSGSNRHIFGFIAGTTYCVHERKRERWKHFTFSSC